MFAKLTRSLIAFGVVFLAYQVYALAVVPLIEPGGGVRPVAGTISLPGMGISPVKKYQELLANYFPPDHWALTGKPKVIETGQVMLVIDDYLRDNTGRVDLTKCVVVAFPTPRGQAGPAPRDAVVIESTGIAELQFDEDFNPARGKIGRLIRGHFPGQISIRSDMREPGTHDDLLIETSDLWMNETLIMTQSEVSFRLGGNRGSGRHMEIILLEEEHKRPGAGSLAFNGVKHLEIRQVDKLELQVGRIDVGAAPVAERFARGNVQLTAHRTSNETSQAADAWAGGQASVYDAPRQPVGLASSDPPLEVKCDGPFLLSFLDFTATLRDNVVATQLSLTGQSDQLTCQTLKVHFSGEDDRLSPQDDPDLAGRQRNTMERLQPIAIEAIGQPAQLNSPSREAFARASNMRLNLAKRQITLKGGRPVLEQGPNRVEAPIIAYQHPAEDEPAAIGQLRVAGPGSVRVAPNKDDPQRTVVAEWNAAPGVKYPVQLTRIDNRPVLLVEGRPLISGANLGRLVSDRIRVAFRETTADGNDGPAIELGGQDKPALLPERIDAVGAVIVQSPELDAKTEELTLWVRPDEQLALGDARGGGRRLLRDDREASKRYSLTAQSMQMDLLLQGRRAEPVNLVCQGGVDFKELANGQQETPLKVTGDRLKVDNLQAEAVQVEVHGAQGAATRQAALAKIVAHGMALNAATVRLDQQANRLWADGAGNAQVSTNRDLFGQDTGAATDLHLRWQGGLNFDGQKITVRADVVGDAAHDWLHCQKVTATLTQPIDFNHARGVDKIEIARIDCTGGVSIGHRGRDQQGQNSHERAELQTLSINRLTGDLSGQGPGSVRSVRLGKSGGALAALAPGARPHGAGGGLDFLRVAFQHGITGNLDKRQLSFHGKVKAVHGPVLAWEHELPLNPPGELPPDVAMLACEVLTVNEDPLARLSATATTTRKGGLGPIELHAQRGVELQGAVEGKGIFSATAATASYSQSKGQFVLSGDNRTNATLYLQQTAGGPRSPWQAKSLSYWPETGVVKAGEFQQGSFSGAGAAALRGTAPRR